MRRIAAIALTLLSFLAPAQDPNPQNSFANSLLYTMQQQASTNAGPQVYLDFNEATPTFHDQISNLAFIGSVTGTATVNAQAGGSGLVCCQGNNIALFQGQSPGVGNLTSFSVDCWNPPGGGATALILVGSLSGSTMTVLSTTSINLANVSGVQTFNAPTDFSPIPISTGQYLGVWSGSCLVAGYFPASGFGIWFQNTSSPPSGSSTYSFNNNNQAAFNGVVSYSTSSGTVAAQQPGMQVNNFSAAFPFNGWRAAPNNTLGAIDWSTPWVLVHHIDNLRWNRSGQVILASKGDLAGGTWWKLYLQMHLGAAQLCFERHGGIAGQGICSGAPTDSATPVIDLLNGYNYDVIVQDDGVGNNSIDDSTSTPSLSMYINGTGPTVEGAVQFPVYPFSTTFANGFGGVTIAVSGGTGYADTTLYTSTGGGANCHVTGVMISSGGVPNAAHSNNGDNNYGCTSPPTIVLTSPTGTGVTLTPTLAAPTMNDTGNPLMVPGYVSGGTFSGADQGDSTQASTNIDEFAMIPGNIGQTPIQTLLYQSNFFGVATNPIPTAKASAIFDEDGCNDEDDLYATQGFIKGSQLGALQIEAFIAENDGLGVFRQMLDQGGFATVPIGTVIRSGTDNCTSIAGSYPYSTYNASTSRNFADYPTPATVYRTVMARHPTTPVNIFAGGELTGLAQFLQSGADSISPLTGQQLWDRDAANGAKVFTQGGTCAPSAYPAMVPCTGNSGQQGPWADAKWVYEHHGAMPMIAIAGTPVSSGPGPIYTRTSKDPMYLLSNYVYGTDIRTAWDSLPMSAFLSDQFYGGVTLTVSGGTGYADLTPFSSTGGGTNCKVEGYMVASGGVPTGHFKTFNGIDQSDLNQFGGGAYMGMGRGCFFGSSPTINLIAPTGTGAAITATSTMVCGTDTYTPPSTEVFTSTGSNCDQVYVAPMSWLALGSIEGNYFQWYLNSLISPPGNQRPRR